ncbi:uncharacterized protein TNCV_3220031 [Trichonephila clavipes]|nr:uncharacterized protein TNCV_3220031 [Trichonephila clavipes]
MHWRHRFPMLFIKFVGHRNRKRRPDTQSKPCFSSCNDLGGEGAMQQPLCQDSPKDVLSNSGLEIRLAIPFVPNRDPPDTPQQSSSVRLSHYHPS